MKAGSVTYVGDTGYGSWGRNGRVKQSGLHATVLDDNLVLEALTSKGAVSTSCSLRIPLRDREAVIDMLRRMG